MGVAYTSNGGGVYPKGVAHTSNEDSAYIQWRWRIHPMMEAYKYNKPILPMGHKYLEI